MIGFLLKVNQVNCHVLASTVSCNIVLAHKMITANPYKNLNELCCKLNCGHMVLKFTFRVSQNLQILILLFVYMQVRKDMAVLICETGVLIFFNCIFNRPDMKKL
ncbi:hypothetical protein Dsin_003936 [Dipteronia sinensis]|uniref:Uncharacterized protein n=1 Tax=Dipteronia sinensis TaxID=43782 RepID=A0AAE0BA20_9ROSI|nr:hypothetical protein Dsin_003936 [Dipteronia sinensis]